MVKKNIYPNIDMQRTGSKIKKMVEAAGYTPVILQEYLHLSCVQPIYRWYKGLILPSVDHLLALSELLNVHMEELLVKKCVESIIIEIECSYMDRRKRSYYPLLCYAMSKRAS